MHESLEGYVETITFRNEENGYSVFTVSGSAGDEVCVGCVSYLRTGLYVFITGHIKEHDKYGPQVEIESFQIKEPSTGGAFLRFVTGGGLPGVRKRLGKRLVDAFGDDVYSVLLNDPERVSREVKEFSLEKALKCQDELKKNKKNNDICIFMQKYEISNKIANKIFESYGEETERIIKENPYRLSEDIKGISFKMSDSIARRMGTDENSYNRLRAGIIYVLNCGTVEGHCFLYDSELKKGLAAIGIKDFENDYDEILKELAVEGVISIGKPEADMTDFASDDVSAPYACELRIYLSDYFFMEKSVAMNLNRLNTTYDIDENELKKIIDKAEKRINLTLDEMQKKAVTDAARNGILLITGGPGTGKTTLINAVINVFDAYGLNIELAAPTGRAAKRMSELTKREAKTIHRLLGVRSIGGAAGSGDEESGLDDEDDLIFDKNELNPLDADAVIIDEMSMVDLKLFDMVLKSLKDDTRLILVGDPFQLPSVGAGNVISDIKDSACIKTVELKKIFRQEEASDIIKNAHIINEGGEVDLKKQSNDFIFIRRDNSNKIINVIYELMADKLPSYLGVSTGDIQVLTPSKLNHTGSFKINSILQTMLNCKSPDKAEISLRNTIFREGDKVIHIKNNYQLKWTKIDSTGVSFEGTGVYNGDTGVIDSINPVFGEVKVRFDDGRFVEYLREELTSLELAYAITIHKAQGSEYPVVIIPMYSIPEKLMNRRLLYTAVTRAKKCVCIVGLEEVFRKMEANTASANRNSFLCENIKTAFNINPFNV